jgi:glycopeptide antibiotics resistance protein
VATLVPAPGNAAAAAATPLWCLVCGPRGEVDVVLNLLLFVPFAVGLRLAGMPFRRIVAWAAGLTLAVETLQATVIPGRDASLSDLLTNTTGAMLGAALAPLLARLGSRLS